MPSPSSPVPCKAASTSPTYPAPDLSARYANLHPIGLGHVEAEQPLFQMRVIDLAVPKGDALRRLLSWTHSRQYFALKSRTEPLSGRNIPAAVIRRTAGRGIKPGFKNTPAEQRWALAGRGEKTDA